MNTENTTLTRHFAGLLILALAFGGATQVSAQNMITLTDAERDRLGIISAPVALSDTSQGIQVPGHVIGSPMEAGNLTALYDGVVIRWLVASGSDVTPGQPLVEIRSPDLLELQREWMQLQTGLDQASFELDKDRQLYEDGVISLRRLEETERNFRNARFASDSAARALDSLGFDEAARQALADTGTGLGLYRIASSTEGILSHRVLEAGESIEAGMVIGEVTASVAPWVEFSAPASFLRRLESGQALSLESGESLRIRMLDRSVDAGTQTFDVHAELDSGTALMPGEIVNVILTDNSRGVWIPGAAVVHNGLDTVVYVDAGTHIDVRSLDLLPSGSGYIASEGLQAGERVVVQGTSILKGIELGLGGE